MMTMKEVPIVEEERHLIPNLAVMAKALFGDDAYLSPKAPRQADWATGKFKIGDGLLWLPWRRQLWLIEVEWKEGSNFFDQSRAFARGKVDIQKLSAELKKMLGNVADVFNYPSSLLKEGVIVEHIVKQTLENHVSGTHLSPHGWVILGHDRANQDRLRKDYEEELKARFTGDRNYVLSMARMFFGDFSTYILLEQHCSKGCYELMSLAPSILVPGVHRFSEVEMADTKTQQEPIVETPKVSSRGRAKQVWYYLKKLYPALDPATARIRIQINKRQYHDFAVDWTHDGPVFLILSGKGVRQKPTIAAREVFGELVPKDYGNILRKLGVFVDVSESPPRELVRYRDADNYILRGNAQPSPLVRKTLAKREANYFESLNSYKYKIIKRNISNRKRLWRIFIEKGQMTDSEFKEVSDFKSKGISGFVKFLVNSNIASKTFDTFMLNEEMVPYIKRYL